MSFRLEVRPQVGVDVASAADWYEVRQPGLGAEWVRAVRDSIEEIRRDPRLPRVRDQGRQIRWILLPRFPYRVVYRVMENVVIVYAVIHTARHDRQWQRRL